MKIARVIVLMAAVMAAGCSSRQSAVVLAEPSAASILVKVSSQKLYLIQNKRVVREYPISTSRYGVGSRAGSMQTPLGRHRVIKKIGAGVPINTVFKERVSTGYAASIDRSLRGAAHDDVTTRILWLEGLEPGVNRGRGVDSRERFIYIHGTTSEGLIGRPASNGCVRMYNKDVIDLFDRVPEGTPVLIVR